jgi:hypothetical protein
MRRAQDFGRTRFLCAGEKIALDSVANQSRLLTRARASRNDQPASPPTRSKRNLVDPLLEQRHRKAFAVAASLLGDLVKQ